MNISEVLLTTEDLLSLKLNARLVVLSWSHSRDDWATSKGLYDLTNGLLMAGAQCILVSLWPVPSTAAKILLRAFYSALLQVIVLLNRNWLYVNKLLFKLKIFLRDQEYVELYVMPCKQYNILNIFLIHQIGQDIF